MAAIAAAAPTIVINTPGASTSTHSAPRAAPPEYQEPQTRAAPAPPSSDKPQAPSINTTPAKVRLNRSSSVTADGLASCYLCDEQNPGDFSPTTKHLETCLLCSRDFCLIHKSTQGWDQVCNINHATYYREMLELAKEKLGKEADGQDPAEVLNAEGIYPSLGEREKTIFATSPVSDTKQKELETFRSLDAEINQGAGKGKGHVEEVDFVGADIAV